MSDGGVLAGLELLQAARRDSRDWHCPLPQLWLCAGQPDVAAQVTSCRPVEVTLLSPPGLSDGARAFIEQAARQRAID